MRRLLAVASTNLREPFAEVRAKADYCYSSVRSINDSLFNRKLILEAAQLSSGRDIDSFKSLFLDWLQAIPNNEIHGLENFSVDFAAGCTQGFDHFYLKNRLRTFLVPPGEYTYHAATFQSLHMSWQLLESPNDIKEDSAVILSYPFANNGNRPEHYSEIMNRCNAWGVPVLLDCCYYPISHGIKIEVADCVTDITFSLSKAFPVENYRIGLRLYRGEPDGLSLMNRINYANNFSATLGCLICGIYSPGILQETYLDKQHKLCELLKITPAQTLFMGLGDSSWYEFGRKKLLEVYHAKEIDFGKTEIERVGLSNLLDNYDEMMRVGNEYNKAQI